MELKLINDQGKSAATVAASDAAFGREFNEALVHQIVVVHRIARQEQPVRFVQQADRPRRMPRQVQHPEPSVAQVDHRSFVQDPGQRRRHQRPVRQPEARTGRRLSER